MKVMRLASTVLTACAAFGTAAGAQDQAAQKIDASALFQPGMSTMQAAREACDQKRGLEVSACFVDQMQAAGATPQAVAFMHAIHNNGFLRDFKDTGRVDIAFVYYPYRANENQGCLLVNGTPNIIDVDDYELLPKADLSKNPRYTALLAKNPDLSVFPGDRAGMKFIAARKLADGGQQFVVLYYLSKCHACARAGTLRLSFEFDSAGKFLGVKIASVQALPAPTK
jgi:hypothetical protein